MRAAHVALFGHGTTVTTTTVAIGAYCHDCNGHVNGVQVTTSFFGTRLACTHRPINSCNEQ